MDYSDASTPHKANASVDYIPQDLLDTLQKKRSILKKRSHAPSASSSSRQLLDALSIPPSSPDLDTDSTVKPATRTLTRDTSVKAPSQNVPNGVMLIQDDKDEELAELRSRVKQLEAQKATAAGPALDIQELQRQFQSQELLLSGYQRENEKCVAELNALKAREKQTAAHLLRLYGHNWEQQVFGTDPAIVGKMMASPRLAHSTKSQPMAACIDEEDETPAPEAAAAVSTPPFDPAMLLAHISSVQLCERLCWIEAFLISKQ
jgi:hypothetical protein